MMLIPSLLCNCYSESFLLSINSNVDKKEWINSSNSMTPTPAIMYRPMLDVQVQVLLPLQLLHQFCCIDSPTLVWMVYFASSWRAIQFSAASRFPTSMHYTPPTPLPDCVAPGNDGLGIEVDMLESNLAPYEFDSIGEFSAGCSEGFDLMLLVLLSYLWMWRLGKNSMNGKLNWRSHIGLEFNSPMGRILKFSHCLKEDHSLVVLLLMDVNWWTDLWHSFLDVL
ncbi:hypothetical protein SESBI_37767 [Sesbania bispinosa]|nr:hypothetical protein SESBI_37767 [Sesbania bispinosa]